MCVCAWPSVYRQVWLEASLVRLVLVYFPYCKHQLQNPPGVILTWELFSRVRGRYSDVEVRYNNSKVDLWRGVTPASVGREVRQATSPVRLVLADVLVGVHVRHRAHRHRTPVPAQLALLLAFRQDRHLRRRQNRGHADFGHACDQGEWRLGCPLGQRSCERVIIITTDHIVSVSLSSPLITL